MGLVTLSTAQAQDTPESTGVAGTVTALDTHHGMATLKTQDGEVCELPKASLWKVDSTVECDRVERGLHPQLQNGKPWA